MKLEGTAALITGAGRGLGAALARELALAGARLALVARRQEEVEAVAEEIRKRGGTAFALPADISKKEAIYPLAGAATALLGPIDLLVHNASSLGPVPLRLLLDTECEDLEQVVQTNLVGPFRLTKILAGSMALRGKGTVVHVSSDAAVEAYPRWGSYSVSKAASDHLARVLAAELSAFGVRVWSVDPGEMDTEMHAQAMPDADRSSLAHPESIARRISTAIARDAVPSGARAQASQLEAP
jgi:NAD(P)-dependent dehydrogenase (short-subunit alcohol dehydrogenase family)